MCGVNQSLKNVLNKIHNIVRCKMRNEYNIDQSLET